MTHRYRSPLDEASVIVAVMPPVARLVSLAGPRVACEPPYHIGLVSALFGLVHHVREGDGHVLGGGRGVDSSGRLPAGGTRCGIARFGERAALLERPAIIPVELVGLDYGSLSEGTYTPRF